MKKILHLISVPAILIFFFLNNDFKYKNIEYHSKPQNDLKTVTNNDIIVLPIEILGAQGTTEERLFFLNATKSNAAEKLWFMANNLSYENKGSIRINEGEWIKLNHDTVELYEPELARGGMVHGGYNTVRFTMPANGLVRGTNKIEFRFDVSDGISIGYRIIRMNVLDSNGANLLNNGSFEEDNPNDWTAPYTDAQSINEGKDLWENADLWSHYLPNNQNGFWYGQSTPKRQTINAKCASCHTKDGRDLEMFSYSNKSIIERSKFHNLTEQQGEKIASYIRSLSQSKDNVERYGRPWNPPYQPGTSVKNMPIEQWYAGAGIDAVLDKDEDMLEYLFPEGATRESVRNVFDSDKMMDRTTLPIAIQFPDWKHWLPIIHPLDAFNTTDFSAISDNDPVQKIIDVQDYFEQNRAVFEANGHSESDQFINELTGLNASFRTFFEKGRESGSHWRSRNGDPEKNLAPDTPIELVKTSFARLLAVKNFEFMNEFNLQDKTYLYVNPEDQPESRQWPGKRYAVFEIPAHFTANNNKNYETQLRETGLFESTNWYSLQMILNGGNGFINGTQPMDFNYHTPHIGMASDAANDINESLRYFSTLSQIYQIRTWSGNREEGPYGPTELRGFRMRHQGPYHFVGMSENARLYFGEENPQKIAYQLDEAQPGLSKLILEALLLQFIKEMNKPENALYNEDGSEKWLREAPHGTRDALDPVSKTTSEIIPFADIFSSGGDRNADRMYGAIPIFKEIGVDCDILNQVVDWSKRAWPNIDFEKYLEFNCNILNTENIKESNSSFNFKVYTVPSNNELNIELTNNNYNANGSFAMYNIYGQKLLTQNVAWSNTKTIKLNTNSLSSGIYIINYSDLNNEKTIKVVIK